MQFHVLSFEGPDGYARAGGLASRVEGPDPREFIGLFGRLRAKPGEEEALRRAGQHTSRSYAWAEVLRRNLLPRLELAR